MSAAESFLQGFLLVFELFQFLGQLLVLALLLVGHLSFALFLLGCRRLFFRCRLGGFFLGSLALGLGLKSAPFTILGIVAREILYLAFALEDQQMIHHLIHEI